jgi:phage-related protein
MAETLPNIPIAFSPQLSEEPRVRRVKFGDGYELRVGDGLNPISMTTSIPWKNRTQAERNELVDFFKRHHGMFWWWWIPPGETQARKFICRSWTVSRSNDSSATSPRFDINCEVYEVHDLGT